MQHIEQIVESAWERIENLETAWVESVLRPAIDSVLDGLEAGQLRVATRADDGQWIVHQWLKKAVLLFFRISANRVMDGGSMHAFDKVPLRFASTSESEFGALGARVVPGALVRRGAHVARDAVLMPSYVNIGAHVGAGTMVDTWA
ncbi:MAG: 2,3,4,5-tetrahydropyridine-2,6-dicarboxylate N-succinyltransferase, partial [Dokdonella sp.]